MKAEQERLPRFAVLIDADNTESRPAGALGFIGLGNMGSRMARRLVEAGYPTFVYDIAPEIVKTLSDENATIAVSPADIAAKAGIVFCSLPTPSAVLEACIGQDGLIEGAAVRIVVDLSTTGPRAAADLAARFRERGVTFIDAPVSGGTVGAEAGTLSVMAAGNRKAFEIVEPMLHVLGRNVFYIGPQAGMGQSMKLVNNMLAATNALAAFETLVMGAKAGLDPQVMLDVINVSSGRNSATLDKVPQCILPRTFPMRFATALLYKDVRLCIEEAEASGAFLWLGQTVKQVLAFAVAQGDGSKDYATIIRHFEGWAGVTVGADEVRQGE
jgi:3-hydroxyisobutyrate dehydrogenase